MDAKRAARTLVAAEQEGPAPAFRAMEEDAVVGPPAGASPDEPYQNYRRRRHKHTEVVRRQRINAALQELRELLGLDDRLEQATILEQACERLRQLEITSASAAVDLASVPDMLEAGTLLSTASHAGDPCTPPNDHDVSMAALNALVAPHLLSSSSASPSASSFPSSSLAASAAAAAAASHVWPDAWRDRGMAGRRPKHAARISCAVCRRVCVCRCVCVCESGVFQCVCVCVDGYVGVCVGLSLSLLMILSVSVFLGTRAFLQWLLLLPAGEDLGLLLPGLLDLPPPTPDLSQPSASTPAPGLDMALAPLAPLGDHLALTLTAAVEPPPLDLESSSAMPHPALVSKYLPSNVALYIVTNRALILDANDATARAFGASGVDQIVGRHTEDLMYKQLKGQDLQAGYLALFMGQRHTLTAITAMVLKLTGELVWAKTTLAALGPADATGLRKFLGVTQLVEPPVGGLPMVLES